MKKIIEPVPYVLGDARLVIEYGEQGINDIRLESMSRTGIEEVVKGRMIELLPSITPYICIEDSWSHYHATIKALEEIYSRKPPIIAIGLRRTGHLLEIAEHHIHHLAFQTLPLYTGSPLKEAYIVLEEITSIKKIIGGKQIAPAYSVPGGVTKKPTGEELEKLVNLAKKTVDDLEKLANILEERLMSSQAYVEKISQQYGIETVQVAVIDEDGAPGYYDGRLVVMENGKTNSITINDFLEELSHTNVPWSHTPLLTYKDKPVLTGPLARFNTASLPPPIESLEKIVEEHGRPVVNPHIAELVRIAEIKYIAEKLREAYEEPGWLEGEALDLSGKLGRKGFGVVESARGLIVHGYSIDEKRLVTGYVYVTPSQLNYTYLHRALEVFKGRDFSEEAMRTILSLTASLDLCIEEASIHGLGR